MSGIARVPLLAIALVLGTTIGFLIGRLRFWKPENSFLVHEAQQSRERASPKGEAKTHAEPQNKVADGSRSGSGVVPPPLGATALVLPELGTFDRLILGNRHMLSVRSTFNKFITSEVKRTCSHIVLRDETMLAVIYNISVSGGIVTVSPASELKVSKGGEPPVELRQCIQKVVTSNFVLPEPLGYPAWARVSDAEGTTVVHIPAGVRGVGKRGPQ